MTDMVSMINLINNTSGSKLKNNNVDKLNKNDEFVSSLKKNIQKSSDESSDTSGADKVELDKEDIKKIEEVIEKEPEELDQEDMEEAVIALTNIIEKLSEFKGSINDAKGEKLALNQSLKGLIKGLKSIKSKFTELNLKELSLKDSKLFAKDELKDLLTKLKGKFINNEDNDKQKMIHYRAINQGNIARLSRNNQNKVERNTDIKGKGLSKDIEVEGDKVAIKSEGILTEKSKNDIIATEQESKEIDFSSVKQMTANNHQNIDAAKPNKVIVGNKEITFKNITNQINNQVDLISNDKGKNVTIELRPEALGRLHLKVTVKDGVVSAKILAENGQVKDLLEGNLAKLKDSLGQKNLQIESFDVATGHSGEELAQSFGENRQFGFSQNQNKGNNAKVNLDDLEELASIEEDIINEELQENQNSNDNLDYIA